MERLRDFLYGEVVRFSAWRGWLNSCFERLRDFCMERLRDFLCGEVA